VRHPRIASRPHVQGAAAPLRLRHGAAELTDGAGLVLLRRIWDALGIGAWLDRPSEELPGTYRPSLMAELWVVLLLYGGGWMDDLALLRHRGIRRLFGWRAVPDPTTFGRWLRRSGEALPALLDELLWRLVRLRWQRGAIVGSCGSGWNEKGGAPFRVRPHATPGWQTGGKEYTTHAEGIHGRQLRARGPRDARLG
jgi:hypothetical protein